MLCVHRHQKGYTHTIFNCVCVYGECCVCIVALGGGAFACVSVLPYYATVLLLTA